MIEPPLCMICNQPMHRLRIVPMLNEPDITIWRCLICPGPKSIDQRMAEAGELDAPSPKSPDRQCQNNAPANTRRAMLRHQIDRIGWL
jgi:hypothetical protein